MANGMGQMMAEKRKISIVRRAKQTGGSAAFVVSGQGFSDAEWRGLRTRVVELSEERSGESEASALGREKRAPPEQAASPSCWADDTSRGEV